MTEYKTTEHDIGATFRAPGEGWVFVACTQLNLPRSLVDQYIAPGGGGVRRGILVLWSREETEETREP